MTCLYWERIQRKPRCERVKEPWIDFANEQVNEVKTSVAVFDVPILIILLISQ